MESSSWGFPAEVARSLPSLLYRVPLKALHIVEGQCKLNRTQCGEK